MISLVTATLGRTEELKVLLNSLAAQKYKDFELIIVDQNDHREISSIIEKYNFLNIKYIRSSIKGLSYNRNIGLEYVEGDFVGFPDDDCYYDEMTLFEVFNAFKNDDKCSFVVSEVKDPYTNRSFINGGNPRIYRKQIYKHCISYNTFVRRNTEKFDEKLGVGSYYGSGEETDYLWSLIKKNDYGVYLQGSYIYHPQNGVSSNYVRTYSYGLGFGAIFKKDIFIRKNYSSLFLYINYIIRTLGGIILTNNRKYYYYSLKGRIKGFFLYK